jgi:rhamnose utilization protein RhaD (predicted bifunctional aldolase and dehydrogenase)/NAD(P)-dependent dehydrogenase (short-subunit alcohol dehydrogenase family)
MKNLWNDHEADRFGRDPLGQRVYTSQLLGRDADLVLHGGGNTSVKIEEDDFFGDRQHLLYVKGSGWDLVSIEREGFAPVRMETLLKMAELEQLSDTQMVQLQRVAMTLASAPNPSVEAILHAVIPYVFVDHSHADAVVTVTNTPGGEERIHDIYGDRVIIIPYVMPGFILAREVYERTRGLGWKEIDGMILLNHGIFTFADTARESYDRMIRLVSMAEEYIASRDAGSMATAAGVDVDPLSVAELRRGVSGLAGKPMIVRFDPSEYSAGFASLDSAGEIGCRGPLTPDHVIRTKRIPVVAGDDVMSCLDRFAEDYKEYYEHNHKEGMTCLDPAPRWGIWPGRGLFYMGSSLKDARVVGDIIEHTIKAVQQAENLGGWAALPERDIFDIEYWELEQAKLKKAGAAPEFQGKIALVTGAASGIGKACVECLVKKGAVVAALDLSGAIIDLFKSPFVIELQCDVTNRSEVQSAIKHLVLNAGGLDIVISNAGTFPASQTIRDMDPDAWEQSLRVNLSSHQVVMQESIRYLEWGIDPTILFVASKNVHAPGPGAAAYSVPKAGVTQLARVGALELASQGIRVNVVHPDAVFDTGIWSGKVLEKRAKQYGLTVDEYKTKNLLKTAITSKDVAELVCTMVGRVFGKTTGAQVPVDGGNDRII